MMKDLLKLNLQLFTDDPEGGAQPGGEQANGEGAGEQPQTFDDILKNKDYQAEFDRRINKALATSKTKWDAQLPELVKQEFDKHKSYEQLTDEEKKQKLIDDEWAKINEAKSQVERSNLIASIKQDLAEKELPIKVGDFDFSELFSSAGDSEKALQAVNAFKEAYQAALQTEVDKRLANSAFSPDGFNSPNTKTKAGDRGKALAEKTIIKQKESNFFKN